MSNSRIEFSTTDFEFSHGRTPRGRGGWLFSFSRNWDVSAPVGARNHVFGVRGSMTYADAKREVSRVARMFGLSGVVVVCS